MATSEHHENPVAAHSVGASSALKAGRVPGEPGELLVFRTCQKPEEADFAISERT